MPRCASAWQGFSKSDYDLVVRLGWQDTSIPVGTRRAVLVGGSGVVRDDGWIGVFPAGGLVAVAQAAGPDYPDVLSRALDCPDAAYRPVTRIADEALGPAAHGRVSSEGVADQ